MEFQVLNGLFKKMQNINEIDIFDEQKKIMGRENAKLDDLLTIPVADRPNWSVDEIN